RRFYNELANPTLWFLQHELTELVEPPSEEAWKSYEVVNRGVAEAVLEELEEEPDTPVWFHDYHLYLAPALVRAARPDVTMSHFIHIPWPRREAWEVLPEQWRSAVHEGLLANDVVGFHTPRWRDNFVACVSAIVDADADLPVVTAHPISVDIGEFEELAHRADVVAEERELDGLYER